MWTRQRLEELADAERRLFEDARFERLATAIARHKGHTHEITPPETETQAELEAALAAISLDELQAKPRHAATDALLAEMLALKQHRPTPAAMPSPLLSSESSDEPDEEAEPQM